METLIDKLATGGSSTTVQNASAGSQAISFSADDIGLPAGGEATLTISGGGYSYSGTASADASGSVTFTIPRIPSGTGITVSLSVYRADGSLLYTGSRQQVVRGDSMQVSVSLARQFWTLPQGIHVLATPAGLLYKPETADTVSSTLSVEGFENAPEGVSYVWTDESGNQLGTGATLTRTANEVTGGTAPGIAPSDDITKTYTVTVSYTDAAGEFKTASASASVTVGLDATIPAFSFDMAAPASMDGSVGTASAWALTDLADGFTLTPAATEGSFPGGTSFHWEIQAAGGSLITRTTAVGEDCVVSPSDMGLDESIMGTQAAPTAITVRCTAKNDRAEEDVTAPARTQSVYLLYTIPAFSVLITPPSSYKASKSDTSDPLTPRYALVNTTDLFTLTPDPTASGVEFPAGTTFSWSVSVWSGSVPNTYSPADTAVGIDGVASFSGSGIAEADIGHTSAAANQISVSCTAHNPHALVAVDGSGSAAAFVLYTMPEFTISIAPPDSYNAANSTAASNTYALTSLTDGFTLTATLPAGESFPPDTTFQWTCGGSGITGATDDSCTLLPSALGMTAASPGTPASPKSMILGCCASCPNAAEDRLAPDQTVKAFRLTVPEFKIVVTPPDGIASETSGTGESATTTYLIGATAVNDTEKTFKLEAVPVDAADSFPTGTKFAWKFHTAASFTTPPSSGDDKIRNNTARKICNGNPSTSGAPYMIECKPMLDGAVLPPANATESVRMKMVLTPADLDGVLSNPSSYITALGITGSGTLASPYKLPPLTGIDSTGLAAIKSALKAHWSSISSYAVYVDLSETQLPDGLDMTSAFYDCHALVQAPQLPSDVTDLEYCFSGCTSLASAPEIPAGVTDLEACFSGCTSLASAPEIPDSVTNMNSCFSGCTSLTSATIPSSVTNMENCFGRCTSLTSAPEIPDSVTNMKWCFSGCTSLTSVPEIPASVTDLEACFENCTSLVSGPVIHASVTSLKECFKGCSSLTSATLPAGVTDLKSCFSGCTSLTSAPEIPAGVTSLYSCFEECTSLTSAVIPAGVTNMCSCFYKCTSLTSAPEIPDSVTDMSLCFLSCTSLTSVTIPDSGASLDMRSCFSYCTSLANAPVIPASAGVQGCFKSCGSLTGNVVIKNWSGNYTGMFNCGSSADQKPGESNPINIYVPYESAREAMITALKNASSGNPNFIEGDADHPEGDPTSNIKVYVGTPPSP